MLRRVFKVRLVVNEISIREVIIDPHYEKKHLKSINDEIILELVKSLNDKWHVEDDVKYPYSYFVTDKIEFELKFYRLVWLLEDNENYIGVINAYRR